MLGKPPPIQLLSQPLTRTLNGFWFWNFECIQDCKIGSWTSSLACGFPLAGTGGSLLQGNPCQGLRGDVRAMGAAPSYFGSVLEDSSPEGPRSLSCCFGSCSVSRKRRWARIPFEIILHRVKWTSIFSYCPLSLAGPSELKIIKFVQCLASKRCITILETSKVISSQDGQRWRPPDLPLPCSLIRKTWCVS